MNKNDSFVNAACSPSTKRLKKPEQEHLERALVAWGNDLNARNVPLSDDLYLKKAKELGEEIGISELQFSYSRGMLIIKYKFNNFFICIYLGWLFNFKKRYNIKQKIIHGESAGVDTTIIENGRQRIMFHPLRLEIVGIIVI